MDGHEITTTSSRIAYENRWMRVREDRIAYAHGTSGLYGVVEKRDFVLVAARDLPIGTRLVPEDLTWMEWPVEAVNVSFIAETPGVAGAAPTAGPDGKPAEPATAEKLAAAGEAMEAARKAIMDCEGRAERGEGKGEGGAEHARKLMSRAGGEVLERG